MPSRARHFTEGWAKVYAVDQIGGMRWWSSVEKNEDRVARRKEEIEEFVAGAFDENEESEEDEPVEPNDGDSDR